MIRRVPFLILLIISVMLSTHASEQPQKKIFICMQIGQNVALSADEDGMLRYIDMIDSTGTRVIPQDTTDGNTYLPFRYICELLGFTDDEFSSSGNHFRYTPADPNIYDSHEKIEIYANGNYVCHQVGIEFSYEASPEDIRNVCIYNINGSLYFPMTYIARLTGSQTYWCAETRDIIFTTGISDLSVYMDNYAHISNLALDKSMYYPIFDENKQDGCYVAADGTSLIYADRPAANIYRLKNDLLYLSPGGRITIEDLSTGNRKALTTTTPNGSFISVYCDDFVIVKNKIYGILSDNSYLFRCDTDGSDFTYLTDTSVSNLYVRLYNSNCYLYYLDKQNRSEVHMIDLNNLDNYRLEITDIYHNNLLADISSYSVSDKHFKYTDSTGRRHTIHLPDPLEKFEIARIADWQYEVTNL